MKLCCVSLEINDILNILDHDLWLSDLVSQGEFDND